MHGAQGKCRLHTQYAGQAGQSVVDPDVIVVVNHDNPEQVIEIARHQQALVPLDIPTCVQCPVALDVEGGNPHAIVHIVLSVGTVGAPVVIEIENKLGATFQDGQAES